MTEENDSNGAGRRGIARAALGLGLAGAALATGRPTPAAAQTVDDLIRKGKLVVAVDTTTPPYGMLSSSMQPEGFDIDLANLIGASLKQPVEFVTVNSPGRIPALLTNRVDLVVSIFSITAERAQQVAFTIPYCGQSTVMIAPKSRPMHGLPDLAGLKVALTRGATEDGILTAAQQKGLAVTILRFDDYPSTAQAMLSGQVDALAGGDYGDIYLKKSAGGEDFELKFPLRSFHFGIGLRRGNSELLHWLNTFIYTIKNDGTLEGLSQKWRKAPLPPLPTF